MPTTSFRKLSNKRVCLSDMKKLARQLGGIHKYGKDTPITMLQILNINGLHGALWALRACDHSEELAWRLLFDYLKHALRSFKKLFPEDGNPHYALYVLKKYVMGNATQKDLNIIEMSMLKTFVNVQAISTEGKPFMYCIFVWKAQMVVSSILDLIKRLKYDVMNDVEIFLYHACLGYGLYEEKWQEQHLRKLLEEVA